MLRSSLFRPEILKASSGPVVKAYRADIDGLRAVAIVSVILYHFGLGFPGGYVGVDIFFVISGYLITLALLAQPLRSLSDFSRFWGRRLRRLLPALSVVTAITVAVSAFVLMPTEFKALGISAWRALSFTTNYLFLGQAGYFDSPSLSKPLLHTWSLAVEGQFYIAFALLMGLLLHWMPGGVRSRTAVLVVLTLASLYVAVMQVRTSPGAAFYTLPARLWEFTTGSLIALGVIPRIPYWWARVGLQLLGLGMIVWAILNFDHNTPFPGGAALLPVLGASLLIHTREATAAPVSTLLETGPMRLVGKISYSLYLWHWPSLVLATFVLGRLDGSATLAVFAIVLVLGALSYRLVEQPYNNWARPQRQKRGLLVALLVVLSTTLAASTLLDRSDGWPGRLSIQGIQYEAAAKDVAPNADNCHTISPERVTKDDLCPAGLAAQTEGKGAAFVVWGDSHAHALYGVFSELARAHGVSGWHGSRAACPPLLGVRVATQPEDSCIRFNKAMVAYVNRHDIKNIFLVARWSVYTDGHTPGGTESGADPLVQTIAPSTSRGASDTFLRALNETLTAIVRPGRNIYLVTGVPESAWHIPFSLARSTLALGPRLDQLQPRRIEVDARQRRVLQVFDRVATRPGVHILSMSDQLCDATVCQIAERGHSFYRDADHLSAFGAHVIRPMFEPAFLEMEGSGG